MSNSKKFRIREKCRQKFEKKLTTRCLWLFESLLSTLSFKLFCNTLHTIFAKLDNNEEGGPPGTTKLLGSLTFLKIDKTPQKPPELLPKDCSEYLKRFLP